MGSSAYCTTNMTPPSTHAALAGSSTLRAGLALLLLLLAATVIYDAVQHGVASHNWHVTQLAQGAALLACIPACTWLLRNMPGHREFGLLGLGIVAIMLLRELSRLDQYTFQGFIRIAILVVYLLCAILALRNWQACLTALFRFLRSSPGRVLLAGMGAWLLLSLLFYADMPWFDLPLLAQAKLHGALEQAAESVAYGATLYAFWAYCLRAAPSPAPAT